MPPTKSDSPSVSYAHDEQTGDHSIGVDYGGVFVKFVTVSDVTFKDRVAAAASPEAESATTTESEG